MDVNVAQASSHEMAQFYELEDFFVICQNCLGKDVHQREYFAPILHVPTSELANNIRMTHRLSVTEQLFQVRVALRKVTYSHRCVYKNHLHCSESLLRGIAFNCFSVPPNSASLLALSLAIKASRPSFTNVVFSLIPVNSDAFSTNSSSMFSVTLILMHPSSK